MSWLHFFDAFVWLWETLSTSYHLRTTSFGSVIAFKRLGETSMATRVLVSDTSEGSFGITLSVSISKPTIAAISNNTIAAITSEEGRREGGELFRCCC